MKSRKKRGRQKGNVGRKRKQILNKMKEEWREKGWSFYEQKQICPLDN